MTSDNFLSSILDHVPIGIFTLELLDEKQQEFRLIHVNDYNSKIVGTDLKRFIGKTLREAFPTAYEGEAILPSAYIEALKKKKEVSIGEMEYEDNNIARKSYHLRCVPFGPKHVMLLTEPTDKYKEPYEKLHEQQDLLRAGESIANLSTWVLDFDKGLTSYTDSYLSVHGFQENEITAETATEESIKRIHPEDQENMERFRQLSLEDLPISEDYRFITPEGEIRWLRDTIAQNLPNGKIIGTTQDITLDKENELKYDSLNRLFREIDRLSPAMTYIYDMQKQQNVYANRSLMEELGYSFDDLQDLGNDLIAEIVHPDDLELVYQHHAKTLPELKDNETCKLTYRMFSKKINEYVWLKFYESVFERDDTNKIKSIVGLAFDVSSEVIAENHLKELNEEHAAVNEELRVSNEEIIAQSLELEETKAKYKELYNTSPEMMASVDLNTGLIARVNDTMMTQLGYPQEELIGLSVTDLYHPDYANKAKDLIAQLKETGKINNEKLVLTAKNGDSVYVELSSKLVKDETDAPAYSNSILRNVSASELLKQALGESEERFRVVANLSPVGIYENDLTGACIYVNASTSKIVGIPMDECLGNGWGTHIHPEDQERVFGNWGKMVEQGGTYLEEVRFLHPDGRIVWAITEARIIKNESGEKTGFMGSIIDVTKQKENQSKLEKANLELNKKQWLLELGEKSAKMGTMIWDIENDHLEYSKEMINIFGFEPDEINPNNFQQKAFERTHPDDLNDMISSMEFARSSFEQTTHENRIILPGSIVKWIRTRSVWMSATNRMIVSIQDITIEKEHELALQLLNENLSSINEELRITSEQLIQANLNMKNQTTVLNKGEEVAMIGSFIHDKKRKKFECTDGYLQVYGIDGKNTSGMDILQLSYDRILDEFKNQTKDLFFKSFESEVNVEFDYQISIPDLGIRWIRGISQFYQNDGTIKGIVQDITSKKLAQIALEEANKKVELSNKELEQFVYSVSHDLRAPVRHVEGYAEWLAEDSETFTEKQNGNLSKIILASNRLGVMIDELLEYSRTRNFPMKRRLIDLNKIVLGSLDSFVQETKVRQIDWQIEDLPKVYVDESMITQVFDNLLSNAVKYSANEVKPVIKISAETRAKDWLIKITDNGVGFNMKYENKLFSVFQRLHKRSEFEGTGIGLANVHRIISRHGGKIWAEGVVNEGAIFYFTLPKISEKK